MKLVTMVFEVVSCLGQITRKTINSKGKIDDVVSFQDFYGLMNTMIVNDNGKITKYTYFYN